MTLNMDQQIESPFLKSTKNTRATLSNFHTLKSQPSYSTGFCGFTVLVVVFAKPALPLVFAGKLPDQQLQRDKEKKDKNAIGDFFNTILQLF